MGSKATFSAVRRQGVGSKATFNAVRRQGVGSKVTAVLLGGRVWDLK